MVEATPRLAATHWFTTESMTELGVRWEECPFSSPKTLKPAMQHGRDRSMLAIQTKWPYQI